MSKDFTTAELITLKNDSIGKLDSLLSDFINSSDSHMNKKASLLSYWLNSYTQYIRTEDSFDSTKLKSYKRGDIIKANFGFNIGSECGGLHYAIVVNVNNARNSSVLTVIPLTSYKEGDAIHPNDVFLGNEIYRNLKLKYDTISQNLQREREEIEKMQELFNSLMPTIDSKIENYDKDPLANHAELTEAQRYLTVALELKTDWENKAKQNKEAAEQLKKIGAEISRMKVGSIAQVEQITTISKMRIYDPRNTRGVLSGIKLSPAALDKVNEKIKELFIFTN